MSQEVLTPITQALNDGAISRRELKRLMKRSNTPGLVHFAAFLLVAACTGFLVWLSMGSWWLIPAMLLHGIVLVHHFSLQHECVHYTAFRSRWINELIGNYCGLVIMLPNKFFRYEHCDHHTYTQLMGRDPELIELPVALSKYFAFISSVPYWRAKFGELGRHVIGRLNEVERGFIPKEEHRAVFNEARAMALIYAAVLAASMATGWWGAVWYWWLPVFMGEPVMRAIRMTEHVGRPNIRDMKENTRTNLVSAPMRFLCWNMNYHAEHHYASSVPFHALPKLHKKLDGYIYVEKRGYLGAHIDIISQVLGKSPRKGSRHAGSA